MSGKVISLYLVDGNPEGIVCSYLSNWTGQAIKIPKNLINKVTNRKEINRPGIYFLIGRENEDDEVKSIYVGESENVYERIIQHLKDYKKNFLEQIIVFSSKDEELIKAHIKFLEFKLIEELKNNSRYILKNNNLGSKPNLSEMHTTVLNEFLENLKILMPALGHPIFFEKSIRKDNKFILKTQEIEARGVLSLDNKFIVLKGSQIRKDSLKSLNDRCKKIKEKLYKEGIVNEKNIFERDYEFNSPSAAAAVIIGTSASGPKLWKYKNKNLEALETEEIEKLLNKLEK